MIDEEGSRLNIGIILVNKEDKLLLAHRLRGRNAWQFPQGGIDEGESTQEAMYRELKEELGLDASHVTIIKESDRFLSYRLPERFLRKNLSPLVIGQKQRWFLLRFTGSDEQIAIDKVEKPEFKKWKWVEYWYPLKKVIFFKKSVYTLILKEFEPWVKREKN